MIAFFSSTLRRRISPPSVANLIYSLELLHVLGAIQIKEQLVSLLKKFNCNTSSTSEDRTEPILKCLSAAFFTNVAKAHYTGDYKHLRSGQLLKIHPSTVINLFLANTDEPMPKYVLYNDIVQSKSCQFNEIFSMSSY